MFFFHFYYSALLLLYDVTNKTSFDNIRAWLVEIHEYAQDDVVILLLGKHNFFFCLLTRLKNRGGVGGRREVESETETGFGFENLN